jgi:hypothetical protein
VKRIRELAGILGARRVKAKLDINDAITNLLLSHFPSFISINSLLSDKASLQLVPVSVLYPNSIGALILDESYSAPVFWTLTYPTNNIAEQFHREIGYIQASIIDTSSNLGVSKYSTMP